MDVRRTERFNEWLGKLKDQQARAKIVARLRRLELGNPGDAEPVGEGVSEMRIHHGPGYRVYYVQRGAEIVVVLAGGTKKTQDADIEKAKDMAREL
jgi:putative addiction module killer protein